LGCGGWVFGFGGLGQTPHPPIPNPQSPIPNPHLNSFYFLILLINLFNYKKNVIKNKEKIKK
jgi:hypothetical protein